MQAIDIHQKYSVLHTNNDHSQFISLKDQQPTSLLSPPLHRRYV